MGKIIQIDKWCIRREPENSEIINKWFRDQTNMNFKAKTDYNSGWGQKGPFWRYLHYPFDGKKCLYDGKRKGYTEITFEEFETQILARTFIKNLPKSNVIIREKK